MIKSRRIKWAGDIVYMREKRKSFRVSATKLQGKRPLGIQRHCWDYNITMD
jgi:hypothetical protein